VKWLLHGLWALLKALLRVVLFAVTGEWVDLDAAGKASTGPGAPARRASAERAQLQAFAQQLEQSQAPAVRARFAQLDRFARAFVEPLEDQLHEQGVNLRKRTPLLLSGPSAVHSPELIAGILEHTRYLPVSIPATELDGLGAYVLATRSRVRALAKDAPGWLDRWRRDLGWPKSGRPGGFGIGSFQSLQQSFSRWLPELATDILTTLQLGPSYVDWLSRGHERESVEAPLVLRVHAAIGALDQLGLFEETERLERVARARFGEAPNLAQPGSPISVPHDLWRAELEGLLASFEDEPPLGLSGGTILDLPGVPYLAADHLRALGLTRAWRSGDPKARGRSARDLLAAALVGATQGGPGALARWGRALDQAWGGPVVRDSSEAPVARAGAAGDTSLNSALRDPHAVREAVILGALMSPRGGVLRPRTRRPSGA
jgi:hypothetical protein